MYFLLNFIWVHDTQRAFMAHKEVKKLTLGLFFFYHIFRPPFLCVFNVAILVKSKKNSLHRKLWLLFKSMLFWNKIIISKQRKTYTVQWSLLSSSTTKLRTNCKVENIASWLQPGHFYTDVLFPFPYQAALSLPTQTSSTNSEKVSTLYFQQNATTSSNVFPKPV